MEKPEFSIGKIIGPDTVDLNKQDTQKHIRENFSIQRLLNGEREKTPVEREIFAFANAATNEVLERYGGSSWDVPDQNVHIIQEEYWQEKDKAGHYDNTRQTIIMREYSQKIVLASEFFHELMHFKSFNGIELKEGKLEEYRSGLKTRTRPEGVTVLRALNEATISELQKRFVATLNTHPLFSDEVATTQKTIADSEAVRSQEELYYAEQTENGTYTVATMTHYAPERKMLSSLIDKLATKNPSRFSSSEEVFDLFARGLFKPNLLELGKLIDTSFGVGTFRKIGELDTDTSALAAYIDSL
jgi:hypothetical protein